MPVDEQLDALAFLGGLEPVAKSSGLGGIALGCALEVLGAGVGRGAAADGPLVGPVAVDVVADAGAAGDGLAVFTPETVIGLGVDEAWFVKYWDWMRKGELTVRVDYGEHEKVVLVQETLNFGGVGVGEESIGKVLDHLQESDSSSVTRPTWTHHGGNPLSRMDGSVKYNGWLPLATSSPEMDTRNGASIQRVT